MAEMLYQGHGSYRITAQDGTVIYVDPCAGEGYDVPADIILVTHEHPDHDKVDKMPHAPGCTILRAKDFQPSPGDYRSFFLTGSSETRPGKMTGVRMAGVQACNKYHPMDECVGIIIEVDGIVFYASGDTSTTEDMSSGRLKNLLVDYAVFPCDGYYNMDVDEASECAEMVDALFSIPVHMVPAHSIDDMTLFSEETAEKFQARGKTVVRPGETISLVPAV